MKKVCMWAFGIVVGIISLPICFFVWPISIGWYLANEED